MESSSKGFMECLTPAVSTAVWALLTRGLTCGKGGVSEGCLRREIERGFEIAGRRKMAYSIVDHPFDGHQYL